MDVLTRLQNVFEKLGEFRASRSLCDVEIVIERKEFYAHKVVLAACSRYFQTMFLGGMAKKTQASIKLFEVCPEIFDQLLQFAYGKELQINPENVEDLIIMADMFQFKDAVDLCIEFMKSQMDSSNCIGLFCFAKQHAFQDLQKIAWEYVLSNFYHIILEDEFLSTPYEVLDCAIKSEFIAITSECDVMQAVLRWLIHNSRERRKHCVSLLRNVRTNLIRTQEIDKMLFSIPDLCLKIAIKVLTLKEPRKVVKVTAEGHKDNYHKLWEPRQSAKKSFFAVGGCVPNNSRRYTWGDSNIDVVSFIERFDSFSRSWDPYPLSLREARTSLAVVSVNRKIYAIGGEKDSMIYATMECYDTFQNTWKRDMPTLNIPRTSCQAVAANNNVYILGGNIGSGAGKSIEQYNIGTNKCKVVNFTMQTERHSFGAVCIDNVIYMAGGIGLSECELKTLECYDLDRHEWWFAKDMTFKRASFSLVYLKGMIFAIGGHNESQGTLKSVEAYDLYKNWWQPCTSMCQARAGAFAAVMDGKIVVVGGKHGVRSYNGATTWEILHDAEVYDTELNSWSSFKDMNFDPRSDGVAVVI